MSSPPESPIWLIGLPGTGKTTLGRCLADRLGRAFSDLDERIAESAGRSIADIFRDEGEDGFRARENAALAATVEHGAGNLVIACGGGIVERPENRARLTASGPVLWLDLDLDTALARCRRQAVERPVLGGPAARKRLRRRIPMFRATGVRIDADGTPARVVRRMLTALRDAEPGFEL